MTQNPIRTRQEALLDLRRNGISVAEFARSNNLSRQVVYATLREDRPCNFGASHKAAVLLGIKDGKINE
jgi:gp16 family phage-associated protein